MIRTTSHFENKESFFENILSHWRIRKVIKHIPAGSRVLDLGCGFSGKFLRSIEHKIESGTGIDISVRKNLETAKTKLVEYDLNEPLPFPNAEFDMVTSLANLEHLENPGKNLREIYRVLRPGGTLLLTTPSTYGKPFLELLAFLGIISQQEINDHKNYFNKKILLALCQQVEFSSFRHQYFQLGMNNLLFAIK